MSYYQTLYHIVFRTKSSEKSIPAAQREPLFRYIWGFIKNNHCVLFRINCMEDHIHILSDLHPSISLADFVRDIKVSSSKWMKESGLFPGFSGWGSGYCAISCSHSDRDAVAEYIKNQQEHHKKESFQDEIRRLIQEQGIEQEEKWFWVDN